MCGSGGANVSVAVIMKTKHPKLFSLTILLVGCPHSLPNTERFAYVGDMTEQQSFIAICDPNSCVVCNTPTSVTSSIPSFYNFFFFFF